MTIQLSKLIFGRVTCLSSSLGVVGTTLGAKVLSQDTKEESIEYSFNSEQISTNSMYKN